MLLAGQRPDPERYTIIPRTLTFLLRDAHVLLLRLRDGGAWSGLHNGLGGHVELGENPMRSALREIEEEAGLTPHELRLCGVVTVDTEEPVGIGLYVFVGEAPEGDPRAGNEGDPVWVALNHLDSIPLVEDLPTLIPRALRAYRGQTAFCAGYRFDEDGNLEIDWLP